MHLSRTGQAAYGTSTVAVMGATPAALVGQVAGALFGPSWLDSSGPKILYQSGGTGSGPYILQSYDTGTFATATVSATGQNFMAAGGGQWAKWLAGSGVSSSVTIASPTKPLSGADLLDVSPSGQIVLCDVRSSATGISVYSSAGSKIAAFPSVEVLSGRTTRLVNNILSYQDPDGWHLYDIANLRVPLWRPRLDGVNWAVPVVTSAGVIYMMERTNVVTFRKADSATGFEITISAGVGFNPDAVVKSSGVYRIGYCTDLGESVNSAVLVDLTLATGATSVGTVSGGTMVFATGDTLEQQEFEVGPLEGNGITGKQYLPYREPLSRQDPKTGNKIITDPWLRALQATNDAIGDVAGAVEAIPVPAPQAPGFGIISGDVVPSVNATTPDDTVNLVSPDHSITFTGEPFSKTVLATVNRSVAVSSPPGRRGDDGRMGIPGPSGAAGVAGSAGPMGPPSRRAEDVTRVVMIGSQVDASAFTSWVPLSLGVEPLQFVSDGAGAAIFVAFSG